MHSHDVPRLSLVFTALLLFFSCAPGTAGDGVQLVIGPGLYGRLAFTAQSPQQLSPRTYLQRNNDRLVVECGILSWPRPRPHVMGVPGENYTQYVRFGVTNETTGDDWSGNDLVVEWLVHDRPSGGPLRLHRAVGNLQHFAVGGHVSLKLASGGAWPNGALRVSATYDSEASTVLWKARLNRVRSDAMEVRAAASQLEHLEADYQRAVRLYHAEGKQAEALALMEQLVVRRPDSAAPLHFVALHHAQTARRLKTRPAYELALQTARRYQVVLEEHRDPTWFTRAQFAAATPRHLDAWALYDMKSSIFGLEAFIGDD